MGSRSPYGLDSMPAEDLAWHRDSACRNHDPDLWSAPSVDDRGRAAWVCHHECAVRDTCLQWATDHPAFVDGMVYGGVYWTRGARIADERPVRPSRNQPDLIAPDGTRNDPLPATRPRVALLPHLDEIRVLVAAGVTVAALADRYATSQTSMYDFIRRHQLRPVRTPLECGTRAGYARHIRARQEPCPPCRQANTEASRRYDAARRAVPA